MVFKDRVLETTTTTGTGNITPAGAVAGFRTFSAALTSGDVFDYVIYEVDGAGVPTGAWETRRGSWNGSVIARTTVQASSNSNALVSFSAGTKHIMVSANATVFNDECIIVALGDETTAITTGTAKVTLRTPYAFDVTTVRASLTTVSSSGVVTVDTNEAGSSVLSTKLTIDASEKTSTTAAAAAVISDSAWADDAEITFDIDTAGTGAAGLKSVPDRAASLMGMVVDPSRFASAGDPYWSSVVLLLKGDGSDGSTTFTDLSSYARTCTAAGGAVNDTDITVGTSPSILLGADGRHVSCAYGSELDITLSSPDFCMEAYIYCTDVTANNQLFGRRRNASNYLCSLINNQIYFQTYNGTTATTRLQVTTTLSNNTVYHMAVIRVGTTYYGFIDGVLIGSNTDGSGSMTQANTNLYIGESESDQAARYWRGSVNWLRVTMGASRYNVAGFTPPSLPLPTS